MWGSSNDFFSSVTKAAEAAQKMTETALKDAADTAEIALKEATETAMKMKNEVAKETDGKDIKDLGKILLGHEEANRPSGGAEPLPWEIDDKEKQGLADEVKGRVLALSCNLTTFTEKPPPGSSFKFNFDDYVDCMIKLVELDPNLGKMQAQLTRTVSEDDFWTNYFYHVHLIKLELGFVSMKAAPSTSTTEVKETGIKAAQSLAKAKVEGTTKTEATEPTNPPKDSPEPEKSEKSEKPSTEKLESWEAEIEDELDDLEISDLEDGDLDSEDDAEIEAQIAAELAAEAERDK